MLHNSELWPTNIISFHCSFFLKHIEMSIIFREQPSSKMTSGFHSVKWNPMLKNMKSLLRSWLMINSGILGGKLIWDVPTPALATNHGILRWVTQDIPAGPIVVVVYPIPITIHYISILYIEFISMELCARVVSWSTVCLVVVVCIGSVPGVPGSVHWCPHPGISPHKPGGLSGPWWHDVLSNTQLYTIVQVCTKSWRWNTAALWCGFK